MALDEPKDSDNIYDVEGFQYIVDKAFMEKVKPIKIDFMGLGFKLDCGIQFQKTECGGCSTTSDCCS